MPKVMIQFQHDGDEPSLQDIARRFAVEPDQIDPDFGVIATDPDAGLYTILVEEHIRVEILRQLGRASEDPAIGEFSNPRIEPFGPPED